MQEIIALLKKICQITLLALLAGDINADKRELTAIKAWHIAYLLKLKAVFTPEIQRARENTEIPVMLLLKAAIFNIYLRTRNE